MPLFDLWAPAGAPPTKLGRHRRLSDTAGLHVSPLCLGGMSIGDKWAEWGMGAMDKTASFALLDAFYAAGGNFVDTANGYQDESSEAFIGEWMEVRGVRDQMVIATKVRCPPSRGVFAVEFGSGSDEWFGSSSSRRTSSAGRRTSSSTLRTSGTT